MQAHRLANTNGVIFLSAYEITGTANFSQIQSAIQNLQSSLNSIKAPTITPQINTSGAGGVMSGLKGSLMAEAGNFAGVGQTIGQNLTMGMTSQFGMAGNVAGSLATALGPVGIAAGVAGAAVIGLGAAAVSSAKDWESLMAGVGKTTGMEGNALDTLSKQLQELSTRIPVAREELATIAQVGGTLGVKQENIPKFVEDVSMAAAGWQMPAEEAANAIAGISNAFKVPIEDASKFGSVINTMADNVGGSEREIGDFLVRASGIANTFGEGIPATAAFGATLASLNMPMEVASTGLQSMMAHAQADPKRMSAWADMMGISVDDLNKKLSDDLYGTLIESSDAIKGVGGETEQLQMRIKLWGEGGSRVSGGLVGMMDKYTEARKEAEAQMQSGESLKLSFEIQKGTLDAQLQMLRNSISNIFTQIGTPLLGPLTSGVQILTSGLNAAAAAGSALVGIIGNSRAFESLKNIGSTIAASISGMIAPLSSAFSTIFSSIGGTDTLQKVFDGMTAPLTIALDIINEIISVAGSIGSAGFSQLDTTIKAIVSSLETAKAYLQAFGEVTGLSAAFDKAKSAIDGIISKVKEIGGKVYDGVSEALPKVGEALSKIAGDFGAAVAKYLTDKITEVANALGLGGAVKKLGEINSRAQEILAGKNAGDAMAEGIKESDALAKAPGEALGSETALNSVEKSAEDLSKRVSKEMIDGIQMGMKDVDILEMINDASSTKKSSSREFEYAGKSLRMVRKEGNDLNQWSLFSGEDRLGQSIGGNALEAFEAITGLPAPKDGTSAYFRLIGDAAQAEKIEMLKNLRGSENVNIADLIFEPETVVKSKIDELFKAIDSAVADGKLTMGKDSEQTDLLGLVQDLDWLKKYYPEEYAKIGGESIEALNDALRKGDIKKVMELKGKESGDAFLDALGVSLNDPMKDFDWDKLFKGDTGGIENMGLFAKNAFQPEMIDRATMALDNLNTGAAGSAESAQVLVEAYEDLLDIMPELFSSEMIAALNEYTGDLESVGPTLQKIVDAAKETKEELKNVFTGEGGGLYSGEFVDPRATWQDFLTPEGGYVGPTELWAERQMEIEERNQQITASLAELESMKHPLEFEATVDTGPALDDITALEEQIVGTEAAITITADTRIAEDRWMNLVNVIQTTPVTVPLTVAVNAYEAQSMVRAAIADAIASA